MDQLEMHRGELTAFSHRLLGSLDAEDAVQETFIRALRSLDRFEGRGTLRSWLYRIATNVCFDMLESRKRRPWPLDLSPDSEPVEELSRAHSDDDPADITVSRETVRLAFAVALQHLPPKQRAVLILREVLRWKASEVAELLGTSVASVNSALQRARATLEARAPSVDAPISVDAVDSELLARYVEAFEASDLEELRDLIRYDVIHALRDESRHRGAPGRLTLAA